MSEPDMKLPEGRHCCDCVHVERCMRVFGCTTPDATVCDFSPSLFRPREGLPPTPAQESARYLHPSDEELTEETLNDCYDTYGTHD